MDHLLTNITGLDMAVCLGLLVLYFLVTPQTEERREGLDTGAID